MRNIKILDCTLRDGGYVNDWNFEKNNIIKIIEKLNESNIEIIECGFLRDDVIFNENHTVYNDFHQLIELKPNLFKKNRRYALMMLAEKYDINNLLDKDQTNIDTIRLSFHKKDIKKAILYAGIIKEKGYKLFLQPTATMRYDDLEILELIKVCNRIMPESVAIVDTFGEMLEDNIIHYSRLFDLNLDKNISLSFHSHNNIQTAYSNAINFIKNTSNFRDIVIDSSIYGMGRGAGNLCSELIVDYLNKTYNTNYLLYPILEVADSILADIRKKSFWGYSIEYYLSAINHCHPNYCIYYSSKKTLTTCDLCSLVESISENKKIDFDKLYAEELYFSYFNKNGSSKKSILELKRMINNREILLLGPGKSLIEEKEKINKLIKDRNKYFVIGVNNNGFDYYIDSCFISNRKRYDEIYKDSNFSYLLTSNIDGNSMNGKNIVFDYNKFLAREYSISDNSLLIILNILKEVKVEKVVLAGFDGFTYEQEKNYYDDTLTYLIDRNRIDELNNTLKKYINLYKKDINIEFLTKSKYNDED